MARVAILGGAESGIGAALLAKKKGFEVFVSDYGNIEEHYKEDLIQHKVRFEESGHTFDRIENADFVIKSPGIPESAPIIRKLRDSKKTIISEIEFASRYCEGKVIGITGSNGKTTTTLLIHHLLAEGGLDVAVGGNIGNSFARLLVEDAAHEYYVLEISSFQLDDILSFAPDIAVILNITADHLDRYGDDMQRYGEAKFKIAAYQDDSYLLIVNGDDEWTKKLRQSHSIKARQINILRDNYIVDPVTTVSGNKFEINDSSLIGEHNRYNMLTAIEICMELGIDREIILHGLRTFKNAPHRMETVAVIDNIEYVNDSKATNVESVYYALKAIDKPIVWIAGGKDKGNDYSSLIELARDRVKAMVCLGLDNEKLLDAFTPIVKNIEESKEINEALRLATIYAEEGDMVLLSPACASFDLFDNYKHRGDLYKKAVFNLLNSDE